MVDLLEAVLRPGDRVCLEGDNQKQADCLARGLAACDPGKVHDLHMVQSGIVLPEHLDVFETGIAKPGQETGDRPVFQKQAVANRRRAGPVVGADDEDAGVDSAGAGHRLRQRLTYR